MSRDEARYGTDARGDILTVNYLDIGDNAYGFTDLPTIPSRGIVGDLDAYSLLVDPGHNYTITAGPTRLLYSPGTVSTNFLLLDRTGNAILSSTDFGSFSSLTFNARDDKYYVQVYSNSIGYYSLRASNNTIVENNGLGQVLRIGEALGGAIDYSSDVDLFTFSAIAGRTYAFTLVTNIPDVYLDIELDNTGVTGLLTQGSGVYVFTPSRSGIYDILVGANQFRNRGAYTIAYNEIDTTPPIIVTTNPADEASGVSVAQSINVVFSESIQRGGGTITIRSIATDVVHESYLVSTSSNISVSGATLTINTTVNLSPLTAYRVEFSPGAVRDQAGNNYLGSTGYNFTTAAAADSTAPTVLTFSPADEAVGVAVDSNVIVTFSEPIQRGIGNIVVREVSGAIVATLAAATSPQLTISGAVLTIDPSTDLAFGQGYRIEFDVGSIKDLAGNSYGGTASYNFTTVFPANTAPVSSNGSASTNEDTTLNGTLPSAQDSERDAITYLQGSNPQHGTVTIGSSGTFIYQPGAEYSGQDSFSFRVRDSKGAESAYVMTLTITSVPDTFIGTAVSDNMPGYPGADTYRAGDGADLVTGGGGNDIIDGGPGIDMATYSGSRVGYFIARSLTGWTVTDRSGAEGIDALSGVERVRFGDTSVAIDTASNEAAGQAVQIIRALFGSTYLQSKAFVGIVLSLLDAGASYADLVATAVGTGLFEQLAGSRSNADFLRLIYRNLVGTDPAPGDLTVLVGVLDSGQFTQASLAAFAAQSELNTKSAELVGIAGTGIEYVPFGG